ncbi:MAG: hypothetical protein E6Q77_01930 [Rhizobium sp.]|nr:MAG: hypothetical protein E6Q77_01930 [Rhizobium sp.]
MAKEVEFHEKLKGSWRENEDWWYLVTEDDGSQHVRHEWSHVDVYRGGGNGGNQTYGIDEFMSGDHNATAKAKLSELLKKG